MGKWKVIALGFAGLSVVGLGIVTWLTPKQGSVEYHKRAYLSAWKGVTEGTFPERIKRAFHMIAGGGSEPVRWGAREEQLMSKLRSHRSALVRIGYLVERRFALKHENAHNVQIAILIEYDGTDGMTKAFISLAGADDVLAVTAPTFEMGRLEGIVREADAPKTSSQSRAE